MSSYRDLGRVKRKIYRGKDLSVSISIKVNDELNRLAYKTKIKNGLITLSYNPSMSVVFENNGVYGSDEKDFIIFAIEEYIDILQVFGKVLKGLNIDEMFSRNSAGELFVNSELKKKYTEVIKSFNGNIVIEPAVVEFFGEIYEGVTFQINNGKKINLPHFEFVKLIGIFHKTDLILLGEQILTNGLLLHLMEKEIGDFSKSSTTSFSNLKSNSDNNKGLLR